LVKKLPILRAKLARVKAPLSNPWGKRLISFGKTFGPEGKRLGILPNHRIKVIWANQSKNYLLNPNKEPNWKPLI